MCKILYTDVPVKEAIIIALQSFYATDDKRDIPRATVKCLPELVVTNVHLKRNELGSVRKTALQGVRPWQ